MDALHELKSKVSASKKDMHYYYPGELAEPWVDTLIKAGENPVNFGFKKIDDVFKGNLRGKVGAILGYGGSKKSLLALNVLNNNVGPEKKLVGVYSSMEMPATEILSRNINYAIPHKETNDGLNKMRPTDFLYGDIQKINGNIHAKKRIVKDLQKKLNEFYGKRILINDTPRMDIEMYDRLLNIIKSEGVEVGMLVIDGLSMMGGKGSNETEVYSVNSGEAKDLAKAHDLFVPMICHCSKGAEYHTRDLRRFVRGSEKILDNVDFSISMSQVKQQKNPVEYDDRYGYMFLHDKRGTGKIVKQIFEFDNMKLALRDSNLEPSSFEVKEKTNKYD